ncbi:MAG: hypothetical protein KKB79_02620, partial [Nanoarchaeota archaeon]|nr:hypothetical protein [Nanoarchaeota archaeon]
MSYKKYTGLGLAGLLYFANPSEAQENRITELQTRINATRIMLADSTTDGLGESQAGADLMRMIAERDSLVVDNSASEEAQTDSTPAIERPKRYPSIIIGTHAGQSRGLEAGVQYGQFALTANYNTAGNETTHEETGPTSLTGMQGQIRTYEGNYNAIGAG